MARDTVFPRQVPLPLDRLAELGTAEFYLRPSQLITLTRCTVQYAMAYGSEDDGGVAAQTGTMVHAGAEAFHSHEEAVRVEAAFAAMTEAQKKFPLADPNEARLYLKPYCADPRNQSARFAIHPATGRTAIEQPVKLILDPHPLDETGQSIHIYGVLDQIRLENGIPRVDDIKTGSRTGPEMLCDYAYQMAAYVLAARMSGFPDAQPGRILRLYGYRQRNAVLPAASDVFWELPFDVAGAEMLMERVRLGVALMRRGFLDFGTGPHCGFCPYKFLDRCIPLAGRKLFSLPMAEIAGGLK